MHYKHLFLTAALTLSSLLASAQQVNTLYFMKSVQDRTAYNPSFQPDHAFYLDLCVPNFLPHNNEYLGQWFIPNFRLGYRNNSFTYRDLVNGSGDFNTNRLLRNLKGNERLYGGYAFNLLNGGFRLKNDGYLMFNITQRLQFNTIIPKELFEMAFIGTGDVQEYTLSRLGFSATTFTEFGIGYSKRINDEWTLGGRLKYLMGQANINTDFKSLKAEYAGGGKYNFRANGTIYSSLPKTEIPINSSGVVDYDNIDFTRDVNDAEDVFDILNKHWTSNWGLGVDLGASYRPFDNFEFSLAFIDLGFIRWNTHVNNLSGNYNAQFNAINPTGDAAADIEQLKDQLLPAFKYKDSKTYTTYLSTTMNVSGEYKMFEDRFSVGLLSSTYFCNKFALTSVTGAANFRPVDWFSTSLSYTLADAEYHTIGAGVQFRVYPFNLYIAADKLPLFGLEHGFPADLKTANLTAGIILDLGWKRTDSDLDGVYDKKDRCPNTPQGYLVDRFGCTVDSDSDGVADNIDQCPNTPIGCPVDSVGCPYDSDGDGVIDCLDQCPNTPQGVQVDSVGCPLDSDGDGVLDVNDQCPDTPQGVQVDSVGCPLDEDLDGVPDYKDQCPGTPAEARATVDEKGCPKDSDGDGVLDYQDKCPEIPGTVTNHGCPELSARVKRVFQQALHGINFETAKDIIKPNSFGILDNVVKVLEENPDYKIDINGHTDSQGGDDYNQDLSERRAKAVRQYLINHGISEDRMAAYGYGESRPIADNATARGRALNRRVEFVVRGYE